MSTITNPQRPVEASAAGFPNLRGHQYMTLTTYRKNGAPVTTPVWFAEVDGKLYVTTDAAAGKLKRLQNNSRVEVGPSDARGKALGPAAAGVGRVLPEAEFDAADSALKRKYGLLYRAFMLAGRLRGGQRTFLEIRPA